MEKSTKVTISLPKYILKAVEEERKARGESRSEFFRRAVEKMIKQNQESREMESYILGYRTMPESAKEVEAAHKAGVAVLTEEPW